MRKLLCLTAVALLAIPCTSHAQQKKYAAVAISSTSYGWTRDYSSPVEAVDMARARCGGSKCTTSDVFNPGECFSIYHYSYHNRRGRISGYGYQGGASEAEAEDNALSACRSRHPGCEHVVTKCQP